MKSKTHLEKCNKCSYKFPYSDDICPLCGWDHMYNVFHKTKHRALSKILIAVKSFLHTSRQSKTHESL